MTTALTRTQLRQELLKRWPFLGWAATADSFGATYVADVSEFSHSGLSNNMLKDRYINRYTLTGNDKVKQITTIASSTGRATIGSSTNYSDQTTLPYELTAVHPDVLDNAAATAAKKQYSTTHRLLTAGHDFDMETSGVNYWDGTSGGSARSGCAPAKGTTYVKSGTQSLYLPYSAASGYVRGEQVFLRGGQQAYSCHQLYVETGTVTVKLYNATTGQYVQTGNDIAYSSPGWGMFERIDTIATDGLYQIEYRGTGASDKVWVDCTSGPISAQQRRFELPSWLDENYKLRYIRPSFYRIPISVTGAGTRAWDSDSRYFSGDWRSKEDFTVESFHGEAHPNAVLFNEDLPQCPIWMAAERSLADTEPMTSETSTTTQPLEQFMAYYMAEAAKALHSLQPENAYYGQLAKDYAIEEAEETLARPAPAAVLARGMRNVRV